MTKLKLSCVPDDRPLKLSIELPAALHRDHAAYAEILNRRDRAERRPSETDLTNARASSPAIAASPRRAKARSD
jgi:hypothetical protein